MRMEGENVFVYISWTFVYFILRNIQNLTNYLHSNSF
jgi:hypothetical protein